LPDKLIKENLGVLLNPDDSSSVGIPACRRLEFDLIVSMHFALNNTRHQINRVKTFQKFILIIKKLTDLLNYVY